MRQEDIFVMLPHKLKNLKGNADDADLTDFIL